MMGESDLKGLSLKAERIWAKKSKSGELSWLPLWVHLEDTAFVAKKLWNHWLSDGVKDSINTGLSGGEDSEDGEKLFVFLAAAHDIGKATPVFQAKNTTYPPCELDKCILEELDGAGLPMMAEGGFAHINKTPHHLMSQLLLNKARCDNLISVVIGAHHGKPSSSQMIIDGIDAYPKNYYMGKNGKIIWTELQNEFIEYSLGLADFKTMKEIPKPNMASQVLLSGLLVMADWIASNENLFPLYNINERIKEDDRDLRYKNAWKKLNLPFSWDAKDEWISEDIWNKRFPFSANNMQKKIVEVVADASDPGIFVLEAPMGSGKTEAALIAAEILANRTKRNGVFFALPTQATSDGIFPRMLEWIEKLDDNEAHSIELAHGKAQFNEDLQALKFLKGNQTSSEDEEGSSAVVHGWFQGHKKALLADFVVGTIDQLLMGALKQKHVMLRHLGLANKVVIIDECHAYDAYMGRYLDMILRWLGAYHVPVIILSATLPSQIRVNVINSYLAARTSENPIQYNTMKDLGSDDIEDKNLWKTSWSYPLLTWTAGSEVKQETIFTNELPKEIQIKYITDEEIVEDLLDFLSEGGCAGIIVNTVKRAQKFADLLRQYFDSDIVKLLHSRFIVTDRIKTEKELLNELGKSNEGRTRPTKRIVVGTQVLEQSLDIDFDILFTDICPMDLLLQRIGRLHRHDRDRPVKLDKPVCSIMGASECDFEKGSEKIYGRYLLQRTKEFLPHTLLIPKDIPHLVQSVYDHNILVLPGDDENEGSFEKWQKNIADKERRAEVFRVSQPWIGKESIVNWLNTDVTDKQGEAAVRDTDESIEVLLVQEISDKFFFFPAAEGDNDLNSNEIPDDILAKNLARQSIRLPSELCKPWVIKKTIDALEEINAKRLSLWQKSPWLKGELFLILNVENTVDLCGYHLTYSQLNGLSIKKKEEIDERQRI